MKFCKNLQRMMDISDPEWAPYYTNYKMLKKLIKELHPITKTSVMVDGEEYVLDADTGGSNKSTIPNAIVHTALQKNHDEEYRCDEQPEESTSHICNKHKGRNTIDSVPTNSQQPILLSSYPPRMNSYAPRRLPMTHGYRQERIDIVRETNTTTVPIVIGHSTTESLPPPPPSIVATKNNMEQDSGDRSTEQDQKQKGLVSVTTKNDATDDTGDKYQSSSSGSTTSSSNSHSSSSKSPLHKKQCCKVPQPVLDPKRSWNPQQSEDVKIHQLQIPTAKDAIRYDVSEQKFFRCLHDEVHKVSYFYNAMIQELYIRYQLIQNTVATRIDQNNIRLNTTNKKASKSDKTIALASASSSKSSPAADAETEVDRPKCSYGIQYLFSCQEKGEKKLQSDCKSNTMRNSRQSKIHPKTSRPSSSEVASSACTAMPKNVVKRTEMFSVNDQKCLFSMSISLFKLSRDLLLLESYCIMALTSFSKILKKHDKVTGYKTKNDFMTKIVIPSNFVQTQQQSKLNLKGYINQAILNEQSSNHDQKNQYTTLRSSEVNHRENMPKRDPSSTTTIPSLEAMIDQCYTWYNIISQLYDENVICHSDQNSTIALSLDQDQRLFLDMIQKIRNNV